MARNQGPKRSPCTGSVHPSPGSFPLSLAELHPLGADLRVVRLEKSCLCAMTVLQLAIRALPAVVA